MPDTTFGFTYPAATDAVAQGAAAIQALAEDVDRRHGIGTTLPASPVNGQEFVLVDSLTAPTYAWRLCYLAGISDANKWVYIGGSPLRAELLNSESTASTTPADPTTPGPSVTVPRAGLYDLAFGAALYNGTNDVWSYTAPKLGAAATSSNDGAFMRARAGDWISVARAMRRALAAADVVKLQYWVSAASTCQLEKRWLEARPVRVA